MGRWGTAKNRRSKCARSNRKELLQQTKYTGQK